MPFPQAVDGLLDGPDVAGALAHRKRVQHRAQEPPAKSGLKQFRIRDVVQRAIQANREQDRVEAALMIRNDQHAAALRDVAFAVDLQIKQQRGQHAGQDLKGLPRQGSLRLHAGACAGSTLLSWIATSSHSWADVFGIRTKSAWRSEARS